MWQTLPLGQPVDDSPYQCFSAHAGNASLIDPQGLINNDWLDKAAQPVSFLDMLHDTQSRFHTHADAASIKAFESFRTRHHHWLEDYALFLALKDHYNDKPWWDWPIPIRDREPEALEQVRQELSGFIDIHCFAQFLFFHQCA